MGKLMNTEHRCRAGHRYVAATDGSNQCWCGESALLKALPSEKPKVEKEWAPGVKSLVLWLIRLGFEVIDSSDGNHHIHAKGNPVPYQMVSIWSSKERVLDEACRLHRALKNRGVDFDLERHKHLCPCQGEGVPQIQACYDPEDEACVITLFNVLSIDAML